MKYKITKKSKKGRYIADSGYYNSEFSFMNGYKRRSYHNSLKEAQDQVEKFRKRSSEYYPMWDVFYGKAYKYNPYYSRQKRRK